MLIRMLYAIKSPGELGTVSSACIHSPAQLIPSLQQTLQPSKVDVYTCIQYECINTQIYNRTIPIYIQCIIIIIQHNNHYYIIIIVH